MMYPSDGMSLLSRYGPKGFSKQGDSSLVWIGMEG